MAAEAHAGVFSHLALVAVEEDLLEVLARGQRPQVTGLGEPVLEGLTTGGVVAAAMVVGAEPGPVDGVELRERERIVGELIADLLAPCPVPALDGSLRLAVARGTVEEVNREIGRDQPQGV